jgi:hypothetical protein
MAKRFSKTALTEHLQARVDLIQKDWGFDPTNGTFQIPFIAADRMKTNPLEPYATRGSTSEQAHLDAANRAYGELSTLAAIADEFNLDLAQTAGLTPKRLGQCVRYRPE